MLPKHTPAFSHAGPTLARPLQIFAPRSPYGTRPLSAVAVNENVGYKTRNESQIEDNNRQG